MTTISRKTPLKQSLAVALIFQLSWAVAALLALWAGAPVNVGLLVALMFMPWVPAAVELVTRTPLPLALQVHYHVFITLSSVAGSTFGFYALVPHWDTIAHVVSGTLLVWLGLYAVQRVELQIKKRLPRWFTIAVALATPLAFAALWEVAEFLSDTFLGTSTQADLEDSVIDMIAAVIGAVVGTLLALWLKRPKSVMPRF